jgi:hypothetical protein
MTLILGYGIFSPNPQCPTHQHDRHALVPPHQDAKTPAPTNTFLHAGGGLHPHPTLCVSCTQTHMTRVNTSLPHYLFPGREFAPRPFLVSKSRQVWNLSTCITKKKPSSSCWCVHVETPSKPPTAAPHRVQSTHVRRLRTNMSLHDWKCDVLSHPLTQIS